MALLALGSACWRARHDGPGRAAMGVVSGMVVYNAGILAVLVHAGLGLGLSGSGLWPAALVHALMAAWCVATLRRSAAAAMER